MHMAVWNFSFEAKYVPAHVLFSYNLETKPLTNFVGTPSESRPNGKLQTHLHNICWAKSVYSSKECCREAWDYVIAKGEVLKNKYAGVVDLQHPTF